MDVAIIGGHGKIALRLTHLLSERGDHVRSIIRKAEQSDDITEVGGEPVVCDIEAADPKDLASAVGRVDACVFSAGAGPGSGAERKETVDYGGAVKLIEAAKIAGIDRYVMISAIGADANAAGDDVFAIYLRAKGRADEALINSGLDYTVVRPVGLTDDPGDGRVHIAEKVKRGKVPREDVAAVVAAVLHEPQTIKKAFDVTDGDDPVEEAVRSL
ncbi:MAG TPA: SDR family oxidoreductase [Actinomycetota bacterium]|nr:SDR family oxidoreductase [Actinomycetota bacterium]